MKTIQSLFCLALLAGIALVQTAAQASSTLDRELDHPWTDGLYSTITSAFVTPAEKPAGCRELKLKVPGFKKELKVRASLRDVPANLVVILNGTFGRADNVYANLWTAWFEQAGHHVLTFDSAMSRPFAEAARHGVPGNLEEEARLCARVIDAFLKQPCMKGKVAQVGVTGISYGGTLALQLSKLERDGALPFKLAGVQAYSAPASFAGAIRQLDGYFSFDYTKVELYKTFASLPREFPVQRKFEARMMECALSRAFREDLKEGIEAFDTLYDAELKTLGVARLGLPNGESPNLREERISHAEALNFGRYFAGLVAPYWTARDPKYTAERLLAAGELSELLMQTGSNVQVIVAANDPLNPAGSVEKLLQASGSEKVTVLPRGGHMGYFDAAWTRRNLEKLFPQAASVSAASAR